MASESFCVCSMAAARASARFWLQRSWTGDLRLKASSRNLVYSAHHSSRSFVNCSIVAACCAMRSFNSLLTHEAQGSVDPVDSSTSPLPLQIEHSSGTIFIPLLPVSLHAY